MCSHDVDFLCKFLNLLYRIKGADSKWVDNSELQFEAIHEWFSCTCLLFISKQTVVARTLEAFLSEEVYEQVGRYKNRWVHAVHSTVRYHTIAQLIP